MPEAQPAGDYATWDPRAYLRQYYAAIGSDELANARFVRETLGRLGRTFATAVEFGCGPTIHHAAMLAPFVRRLHLADYLDTNLDEVRRWLRADPEAYDWDAYLAGLLADEGRVGPGGGRGPRGPATKSPSDRIRGSGAACSSRR